MQAELGMLKEFQNTLTSRLTEAKFHDKATLHKTGNQLSKLMRSGYNGSSDEYDEYLSQTDFAMDLIKEESEELAESLDSVAVHQTDEYMVDPEHVLKEVCDLLYVTIGFASRYVEFDNLPEAFKRVHENNMLKISNGTLNGNGKLIKTEDHPKVDLSDLVKGN
tara:strand:- start:1324 stop:1815 length:492 start_codon:yes stop_codon:yes gene_type:complete